MICQAQFSSIAFWATIYPQETISVQYRITVIAYICNCIKRIQNFVIGTNFTDMTPSLAYFTLNLYVFRKYFNKFMQFRRQFSNLYPQGPGGCTFPKCQLNVVCPHFSTLNDLLSLFYIPASIFSCQLIPDAIFAPNSISEQVKKV
ncbi:hypothetical protein NQ314_019566 [Rhamnusium bicolor]|uniref:Uncharacterized protein n=1 Tax=Rhamnusium bicolor TaxID=1586634 RepID=A0AAV8WP61_9CUCU|nr:hypothetical protein NQ314_019566 [Rhamnusium bicolor]